MNIKFCGNEAQYRAHKESLEKLLLQNITSETLIGAQNVSKLESALAAYVGTEEAIVCNNQFNAFVLLFICLGLKAGDEVITSPLASGMAVEAILFMGGRPVFVDINESDCTIDATQIEDAITERTKIIIPVSLFGRCADMQSINALGLKHDLCIIEDAAQSFGSNYEGRRSCGVSKLAAASFHPDMPLSAYGNGAALFIADAELRAKARVLLSSGRDKGEFRLVGIDAELDEIQAALLHYKLAFFDEEMQCRQYRYEYYNSAFKGSAIATPKGDAQSNFAFYPVRVKARKSAADRLLKAGIEIRVPFHKPLYLHEAFKVLDYHKGDFPATEKAVDELLLLPLHACLSEDEQNSIVKALLNS